MANPIKLIDGITKIVNTGLSLVSEKTRDGGDSVIKEKDFVETTKGKLKLSSKRVMNITGAGGVLVYGMGYLTKAETTEDKYVALGLIFCGVLYSLTMSYITYLTEKTKKT